MRNTGYRILAEGQTVSNDTWATGLNNNDVIIGPSGAGKSRGYVKPNLLQGSESILITDPKGSLRQEVGPVLERSGYRVREIDLADCLASPWGYNPLDYVRHDDQRDAYREQDIMTIAACLVPLSSHEQFWDLSARMLLEALIGYVLECLPDEEHDLYTVSRLLQEMGGKSFDYLFSELEQIAPGCFPVSRYRMFRLAKNADKMFSSILGILAANLSPYTFDGTRALFQNSRKIIFPDLGQEKTAVFLTVSDTDRAMDGLANLFYTQALQSLCAAADKSPGHRLAVPVRFILDDFAANTCIPDFDKTVSVVRSREISVSVILQSLSQLEALYGHAKALTILNNCDHFLYLGGQDVETATFVSKKANRPVSDILNMPLDSAWLFTRGSAPRQVRKFKLESHPRYRELPESHCDGKWKDLPETELPPDAQLTA